jgi:chromosome segregation ATPase
MAAQLAGMKRTGHADPMELRSLSTRAVNAERRLNNAQNQLAATEEKIAAINQKSATADSKWEARVKEYESRLKAAEEKVKRERQGGKERVQELENSLKYAMIHYHRLSIDAAPRSLQRQLDLAQRRNQQLGEVVESSKTPSSPAVR